MSYPSIAEAKKAGAPVVRVWGVPEHRGQLPDRGGGSLFGGAGRQQTPQSAGSCAGRAHYQRLPVLHHADPDCGQALPAMHVAALRTGREVPA